MTLLRALALLFLLTATAAMAAPYDETANAKLDIQHALARAATHHKAVIVVFGANWCGDCKMLNSALTTGASAPLLARDFQIVKVNVGRFDQNVDLAKSYGVPLEKGIPAVVILSSKNRVLYVTRQGELADARKMGDRGIYDFFKKVTASTKTRN